MAAFNWAIIGPVSCLCSARVLNARLLSTIEAGGGCTQIRRMVCCRYFVSTAEDVTAEFLLALDVNKLVLTTQLQARGIIADERVTCSAGTSLRN